MTRKEIFAERLEVSGDFWRVVQDLVNEGWNLGDLEDAGVVQDLYGFTDSTFEENVDYLRNMLLAPRHRNIVNFFDWLRDSIKDPSVLNSEAGRKAWINDIENSASTTGGDSYEIPGRLTKSGNPDLYFFSREWFTTPDGEEDYRIIHG